MLFNILHYSHVMFHAIVCPNSPHPLAQLKDKEYSYYTCPALSILEVNIR
jgi:hypothetical protein